MSPTVSILAEIPEELHQTLRGYLETHPDWDQDRVFAAALSLFLMQNGDSDRRAARVYLDTLFNRSVYR
jgi:predicted TPR repeat methyltransferase